MVGRLIQAKTLVWAQLLFVAVMLFGTTELGLPDSIKGVTDVLTCSCVAICLFRGRKKLLHKKINAVDVCIFVYFIYCLFSSISVGVDFGLAIWAFRTTFRFYLFYYCCTALLDKNDALSIYRGFEALFFVNFALVLFQLVFQHKSGDYLGGMFGIEQGANTYMNIYLVVIMAFEVAKYLEGVTSLRTLAVYMCMTIFIVVFSELKFMLVELAVIFLLTVVFSRKSLKTALFVVVVASVAILGLRALQAVYPESYDLLFDSEGIEDYLSASWANGQEIGRTTAIDFIDEHFHSSSYLKGRYGLGYDNALANSLFGIGFGGTENSVFADSEFAATYATTNYSAFELAFRYLETGYVGLLLYAGIYVAMFMGSYRRLASCNDSKMRVLCISVCVLVPLVFMNIWYGCLRYECTYILFFALSCSALCSGRDSVDVLEN